ncbi:hypothetical protein GCM10028827_03450 [Mucilaginibacter myungsuensis]
MQEKTGFNRVMQNVTAKYNILFNAREILAQKQEAYELSYIDAYDNILSVYQDTITHGTATDKELDAALVRANTIISEKDQSKYIGDANLVLGKASHLYGRYFNAVEYFKYVTLAFKGKKEKDVVQEARVWMARSLLYLNMVPQAKTAIDSAMANVNPKKKITADVYATATQFYINTQEYAQAEANCKLAVQYANTRNQTLRWTFILAQLQELNNNPKDAYLNYSKVVKSNASFEMAFNADLNRIRIEDAQASRNISRMERLRRLLRDDKNEEFKDQIYYQMALMQLAENDLDNAVKNLQLSIRNTVQNQNQKGLSYLRLAELNFKNRGDYITAKMYYDSTLTYLSHNYPNYIQIKKKSENLQVLADRLQVIGREDTLQSLAKLSDSTRTTRIEEFTKEHVAALKKAAAADPSSDPFNPGANRAAPQPVLAQGGKSNFYFDNARSVSQGINDFRRVWGNRKLEDNWRRSQRAGGDVGAPPTNGTNTAQVSQPPGNSADEIEANNYRQKLIAELPLTTQQLEVSNIKVYNAYTDIANFYRDILADKREAILAYETLLTRYPNDPNKAAVYYNLYRLYSDIDPVKSQRYKDLLLGTFPTSLYARVILDPDYSKKLEDKDAELNGLYDQVYDKYINRKYTAVMASADSMLSVYPENKLSAQLLYLRAIANGHQVKYDPFRADLQNIATKYPNDLLITPLIAQHMIYLDANQDKMRLQEFALIDSDPTSKQFIPAPVVQQQPAITQQPLPTPAVQKPVLTPPPVTKPPAEKPKQEAIAAKPAAKDSLTKVAAKPVVTPPVKKDSIKKDAVVKNVPSSVIKTDSVKKEEVANVIAPPVTNQDTVQQNPIVTAIPPPAVNKPTVVTPPVVAPPVVNSIYSLKDSTNYYFVVNVATGTANLASSRFGVGQYNRANYTNLDISHQLKNAGGDNQLIYVGRFTSLNTVKNYARAIIPLMSDIMKVPANKYSFFIITKENLDKLADKKTLDQYVEFYQNNY